MLLDPEACHRALSARDARFDGRFFVGVGSTGIYCRPICPARTPRPSVCRYFVSAAAAERAGHRPCRRCRPELAPGCSAVDARSRLAQTAARRIEDGLGVNGLAELARELGVSDRHLRRAFRDELGASPVQYAQTHRLLLALRLLADTRLSILEVAMASGFGSVRRFNALVQARYRMSPTALRRASPLRAPPGLLAFDLPYRPPYDWDALHQFLARRAVPGVEHSTGRQYRRTLRIGEACGWIEVAPAPRGPALRVWVAASLSSVLPAVLSRTRGLLDLAARPDEIARVLGPLAAGREGLRVPGAIDGSELALRAVLGQQVTVSAGTALAARLAAAFGAPCATPQAALHRTFPTAREIAAREPAELARLGIPRARARALVELARAVECGTVRLDPTAPVEATMAALHAIPGIGPWTAQYIAMRALNWPDAFPHPDAAIRRALGASPREIAARSQQWRPWRAYAAMHLWTPLENTP